MFRIDNRNTIVCLRGSLCTLKRRCSRMFDTIIIPTERGVALEWESIGKNTCNNICYDWKISHFDRSRKLYLWRHEYCHICKLADTITRYCRCVIPSLKLRLEWIRIRTKWRFNETYEDPNAYKNLETRIRLPRRACLSSLSKHVSTVTRRSCYYVAAVTSWIFGESLYNTFVVRIDYKRKKEKIVGI